jgi:hypothetical protein
VSTNATNPKKVPIAVATTTPTSLVIKVPIIESP